VQPQPQSIGNLGVLSVEQPSKGRIQGGRKGSIPRFSHSFVSPLSPPPKGKSKTTQILGYGCTKHGKTAIQDGNLDPLYEKHFKITL
jgi:hypothetical protein